MKSKHKTQKGKTAVARKSRAYVCRLKKIRELATEVLEDEGSALAWLRQPQPGLGGRIPLDLLDTETGYEQVLTLLNQLEHGVLP